jgi:hypothetical protein
VTGGEAASLCRRDTLLWKLGTELSDRIADLCGLNACPRRLLHHVCARLKRNPLNFRPKFPEPLWSDGLKVLDGPISIDWQNWTVEILVQDWIALGEGWEDGAGWREAAKQLGIDAIDANDLLAVHGKTFPIEIFDEAIKKAVAEVRPRLARDLGAAPPAWPHEPVATATEQAVPRQTTPTNPKEQSTPEPSRALPAASDDQVHVCIEALHKERKGGEPPLNREVLYDKAPKWLAENDGVWAGQKTLRRCFMEEQHKDKRRARGRH